MTSLYNEEHRNRIVRWAIGGAILVALAITVKRDIVHSAQTVYAAPNTRVFHRATDCFMLLDIKHPVAANIYDAIDRGYQACPYCIGPNPVADTPRETVSKRPVRFIELPDGFDPFGDEPLPPNWRNTPPASGTRSK